MSLTQKFRQHMSNNLTWNYGTHHTNRSFSVFVTNNKQELYVLSLKERKIVMLKKETNINEQNYLKSYFKTHQLLGPQIFQPKEQSNVKQSHTPHRYHSHTHSPQSPAGLQSHHRQVQSRGQTTQPGSLGRGFPDLLCEQKLKIYQKHNAIQ